MDCCPDNTSLVPRVFRAYMLLALAESPVYTWTGTRPLRPRRQCLPCAVIRYKHPVHCPLILSVPSPRSPERLSELESGKSAHVINVLQLQLLEFLALGMEIDSANRSLDLVEADIIEAFEARALDLANVVIGH